MSFLIFFAVISVLILSHETGHFLVAKKAGAKVEEFGFGFPPRLFSKKIGETVYSFNLFPVGGFVKIFGEDGARDGEESGDKERSFAAKSAPARAAILAAGVFFNIILAWVLISASFGLGSLRQVNDHDDIGAAKAVIIVAGAQEASPAEKIGIAIGDVLEKLKSETGEITPGKISEVQRFVNENRGKEIEVSYKRGNEIFVKKALLRDIDASEGALGVAMARAAIVKKSWFKAPFYGLKETIFFVGAVSAGIFYFFVNIFQAGAFEQVAGPIGIFQIVSQAPRFGASYLFTLSALISINLAVINLLPFPALDGGRLLFLLIEKIRNKPISAGVANTLNALGFAILILLMIFITYNDILRIVG